MIQDEDIEWSLPIEMTEIYQEGDEIRVQGK